MNHNLSDFVETEGLYEQELKRLKKKQNISDFLKLVFIILAMLIMVLMIVSDPNEVGVIFILTSFSLLVFNLSLMFYISYLELMNTYYQKNYTSLSDI